MRVFHLNARAGAVVLYVIALLPALPASAANWLLLQGTEPAGAPAYRPYGFVGIEYLHTDDSRLAAGSFAGQAMAANRIGPRLENTSELQVSHVRLGLRGRLFDGKLDYRLSPLAGDNGISHNGGPNVKFTDVSVTLNLIPYARIRMGQFRHPGSEEGLQPTVLRDYIRPTNLSRQLTNERFFDHDGALTTDENTFDGPVSGWRNTGVQVFDAFRTGAWEHTYALMAGTGSGLAIYNGSGSGRPDWHLYWSSEWLLGGKGPFREGLKLFGWYQDGERELRTGTQQRTQTFDRRRYGLGATFRQGPWRVMGEWVGADGMIPGGTDGGAVPGAVSNNGAAISGRNVLPDNEADGWYLDGGYTLFDKWELRARYDRLDRGTDGARTERRFETFTLGLTYRHNKHVRLLADYEFREAEAPGLSGDAIPNRIMSRVDDVFGVKLWAGF
ncbi:MAG: OprO/OprP family phosphate-selective porin [Candidatus Thiosymbion ectosymbiont of Robbea hypermnestra]|nr:OprO/OprP family phosphate-selective porin [Candidatus Thiosymbion ectosymbiont of Robbea hypermnestra]